MLVEAGEMGRLLDCGNGGRKVLAAVCSGLGRERRRRSGELSIFVNIVKHAAVLIRLIRLIDWSRVFLYFVLHLENHLKIT